MRVVRNILALVGVVRVVRVAFFGALRRYTRVATCGESEVSYERLRFNKLDLLWVTFWQLSGLSDRHGHEALGEFYASLANEMGKKLGHSVEEHEGRE